MGFEAWVIDACSLGSSLGQPPPSDTISLASKPEGACSAVWGLGFEVWGLGVWVGSELRVGVWSPGTCFGFRV